MPDLYPEIEPHDRGMLDVGDGHRIHWEVCGNPHGKPAVVLHGGPGSGCTPVHRRFFDPARYCIVLFDQRNCGRSTPHASEPGTHLSTNTTQHLIADMERLRKHLGIDRWLVLGGSWGVALGLAYAQAHRERVTEMVLFSVGMPDRAAIHWLYHGVGASFPAAWSRFSAHAGDAPDLVAAYCRLLNDPDLTVREAAARAWCEWEDAVVSTAPNRKPGERYADPRFRMCFARIVTHYFHHACWMEDGALLRGMRRLADVPAVLIHGRADLGTPVAGADALARAWPGSRLMVVDEAGHELRTPGMRERIVEATDGFAG